MATTIEYRVRPVTRYIVTRFEGGDAACQSSVIGEFDRENVAFDVSRGLIAREKQLGRTGPVEIIEPEPPMESGAEVCAEDDGIGLA